MVHVSRMPGRAGIDTPGVLHHTVVRGIERGKRPDLAGVGLIRNIGGRSEVKSIWKGNIRLKGDERIPGLSDHVLDVLKGSRERPERKYGLPPPGHDLALLTRRVAGIFEVTPGELFSPGKYKKRVQAQSVFNQFPFLSKEW